MEKIIMIKYGELTTKKSNRKLFINILDNNIKRVLGDLDYKIKKDRVRMYIESEKIDQVQEKLKKVFGIHGIVICYKINNDEEEIKETVLKFIDEKYKTFKVVTRRALKTFPIPSTEFSSKIGGHILRNSNMTVDVHNPELTIHIELRIEGCFVYSNEIRGMGGYPVGVQGKGLLMLSGGIDSPVAGFLAMKRGVDLECLYFESPPHTSIDAKNKVLELANILSEYSGKIRVHVVPFTKIQEAIYKNIDNTYMITIMRRMMYRIAEEYAKKLKCKVIINGESIGQVASQTLTSMAVINEVVNMPVIRPVSCLDKLEIIDLSYKIGTYETSILPYEDCCTIFVPKHPVINPNLNSCILFEQTIDYDDLIKEAIKNIEVITDLNQKKHSDLL